MNIAYLTTKYPSVSHTFIRRELLEIERRGHRITRMAIRHSDAELVDPVDREETKKTIHCLAQPLWVHAVSLVRTMLTSPICFSSALSLIVAMGLRSERGIFKHLAYLIEACTLLHIMRKMQIRHIHAHFGTNSAAVARLINRCGGPGFSFTVHGPTEFDAAIGFDLPGKIADAAFVIAITDYCSAQLRRWSRPEDWQKIHVVHCTVGNDFFEAAHPIDPQSRTFVCVGRLTPQKGQLVLIDAFVNLMERGYDAKLVFVGDGELRSTIEKRISAAKMQDRISITGYVSEEEVRKHISASRALVLPSFAEGLPMVIMEAFAVGRPVISTYIAGIPELVRNEENGWLVPAGNIEHLVAALVECLDTHVERLEEMARSGRELTHRNHHTITEGDRLEKIFRQFAET